MALQECFVCHVGAVQCHIQVTVAPGRPAVRRAVPWVQDGLVIRPVLDEGARRFEVFADTDGDAVTGVLAFLEGRFGQAASPPRACDGQDSHIEAKTAPLRWKDTLK